METLPIEDVLALPVYPTADIFPMLVDAAEPPPGYDGLTIHQFADQILLEGVKEPLVIWKGQLIDGRNRREASRLVNKTVDGFLTELPVRYAEFASEQEVDDYILSAGLDRRSMNKDQLACSAVRYWEIESDRAKQRQASAGAANLASYNEGTSGDIFTTTSDEAGKTRDILARRFHVSGSYVQKARNLYIGDRQKFELAASGKQRVLAGLKSPGQTIRPELTETPVELAQRKFNNAENHVRTEIKGFKKVDDTEDRLQFILDHLDALKEFTVRVWTGNHD